MPCVAAECSTHSTASNLWRWRRAPPDCRRGGGWAPEVGVEGLVAVPEVLHRPQALHFRQRVVAHEVPRLLAPVRQRLQRRAAAGDQCPRTQDEPLIVLSLQGARLGGDRRTPMAVTLFDGARCSLTLWRQVHRRRRPCDTLTASTGAERRRHRRRRALRAHTCTESRPRSALSWAMLVLPSSVMSGRQTRAPSFVLTCTGRACGLGVHVCSQCMKLTCERPSLAGGGGPA